MAKNVYIYTTDGGNNIKVILDDDKAALGGFNAPGAGDQSPVVPGFSRRMRGVYAENTTGANYFFPMATNDEAAYATEQSTLLTYKGDAMNTCSRRGEKVFWGSSRAEGEETITPTPAAPVQ